VKSGLGTRQVLFFLGKTYVGIARQRKSQKVTFWSQGALLGNFGPLLGVPFCPKEAPGGGSEMVDFQKHFFKGQGSHADHWGSDFGAKMIPGG